jgi:hypothetical protein
MADPVRQIPPRSNEGPKPQTIKLLDELEAELLKHGVAFGPVYRDGRPLHITEDSTRERVRYLRRYLRERGIDVKFRTWCDPDPRQEGLLIWQWAVYIPE